MTDHPTPPQPPAPGLEERLAAQQAQIDALSAELEETNRGVLALYAELDVQAQALAQANELKSRFLAYMSHEFRTPIASILSISRLLLDQVDGPLAPEQTLQVGLIRDTALEFSSMVDDLLDLAKVEAGRVTIAPAWFDMVQLFAALRGMFKPVLTNPDVTLAFEPPPEGLTLFSDDKKLAQILRNYISNALKFTQRGEVRVSVRRDGDHRVTFLVSDTGIGIPPELQGALFEDFSQLETPLHHMVKGTGLGLALSKKLALLLGGQVGVHSTPGEGSTFHVTLPLRWPPEGAA
ncbi:HAMP domain-containing sensor histidine kinase [Aquabacterium sp. J223]|uniref:sensor histidine kinase n=1 Tax=Aquabacterium sp. J223 TaxID=2898431 RepID=UPI0021ADE1E9|nr:ATP-binding protein [Aquabacterium sp. J223]UUX94752.1 ATP-binding protein [Aquabacterium sp. J223]